MNSPYLIFDLDGTLVNSLPDLTLSLNLLRGELDLEPLAQKTVESMVGDGASLLVRRALGEDRFEQRQLDRFMAIYDRHLLDNTTCFPGIAELLAAHPAARMAVVTNKPYALTVKLLEGLKIDRHFKAVIGGDSLAHKKPHPLPVRTALSRLAADPRETVMIGDHHTDINSGRAAGTKTCFCAYGIGHADGLPYDYRADRAVDLLNLFPG